MVVDMKSFRLLIRGLPGQEGQLSPAVRLKTPPKRKGYKEEQDLMVLQRTAQPHQGNQEEEDAHTDDPRHHPDAGDQVEPFPPGRHSDQEQTHQLRKRRETRQKKCNNVSQPHQRNKV